MPERTGMDKDARNRKHGRKQLHLHYKLLVNVKSVGITKYWWWSHLSLHYKLLVNVKSVGNIKYWWWSHLSLFALQNSGECQVCYSCKILVTVDCQSSLPLFALQNIGDWQACHCLLANTGDWQSVMICIQNTGNCHKQVYLSHNGCTRSNTQKS